MRWLYFAIYEFQLRQQEKKKRDPTVRLSAFFYPKRKYQSHARLWHPKITAIVIGSYEEREGQTRVSLVTPNSLSLENKIVLQLSHSSPPHELPKQPSFLGSSWLLGEIIGVYLGKRMNRPLRQAGYKWYGEAWYLQLAVSKWAPEDGGQGILGEASTWGDARAVTENATHTKLVIWENLIAFLVKPRPLQLEQAIKI